MMKFNRQIKIIIGDDKEGFQVNGDFKLSGKVTRDLRTSEPDSLQLTIWNLSKETRAKCIGEHKKIAVELGYGDNLTVVFAGDIQKSGSVKNGVDWETKIIAGDGAKALAQAKLSKTYAKGVTLQEILDDTADVLKIEKAIKHPESMKGKRTLRGKSFNTSGANAIDTFAKAYDFEWSIHNGVLVILPKDETRNSAPYLINQKTGLIGSPDVFNDGADKKTKTEYEGIGIKFKTLMQPDLMPGDLVVVESLSLEGQIGSHKFSVGESDSYRMVCKLRNTVMDFDSDRGGGDFSTSCEGLSITGVS